MKLILIIISSLLGLTALTLIILKLFFTALVLWKSILVFAMVSYLLKLIYIRL